MARQAEAEATTRAEARFAELAKLKRRELRRRFRRSTMAERVEGACELSELAFELSQGMRRAR